MMLSRSVLSVSLAVFFALSAAALAAEQDLNPTVNLELKDVPVKEAIDKLFSGTQLKYTVDPNTAGKVVELKLKGVTLKQALDALCEAANLTYTVTDGVYSVKPKPGKDASDEATKQAEQSGAAQTQRSAPSNESQSQQSSADTDAQVGLQKAPTDQIVPTEDAQGPVYYGQPQDFEPYELYPPFAWYDFRIGGVRYIGGRLGQPYVIGGPPTIVTHNTLPLRPGARVGPDVRRFLETQYMIRNRLMFAPVR